MALKEGMMKSAVTLQTVLNTLQGTDLGELKQQLKQYVAPLLGMQGRGKENQSKSHLYSLAKEYVPALVQILKVCAIGVASVPSAGDEAGYNRGDDIFSAMILSLDTLSQLRPCLVGSSYELEIHRYRLVRRLMAWKKHTEALHQSELLVRSICESVLGESTRGEGGHDAEAAKKGAIRDKATKRIHKLSEDPCRELKLRPPQGGEPGTGLAGLIVGAVSDFVWCVSENMVNTPYLQRVPNLLKQLDSWLRLLDAASADRQLDTLFRSLYKITLDMVARPRNFGEDLILQFCTLTMCYCALSSHHNQYAKVARKLCSSLTCYEASTCSILLEVCDASLTNITLHTKLHKAGNSFELLELVDGYARMCQTTKNAEHGYLQIKKLMEHFEQVFPKLMVAITGLYAVGLWLEGYATDQQGQAVAANFRGGIRQVSVEHTLNRLDFDHEVICLLQDASDTLKREILPMSIDSKGATCVEFPGHFVTTMVRTNGLGEILPSTLTAVSFLQRSSNEHVQSVWNKFVAVSCQEVEANFTVYASLQKLLCLYSFILNTGLRCTDLTEIDKEVFRKHSPKASQAVVTALKLSLLCKVGVKRQGVFKVSDSLIQNLHPEEQAWLISSIYNVGVQIFNTKQYELACEALNLAYEFLCNILNFRLGNPSSTDHNLPDLLSEVAAKCLALVDARKRCADSLVAMDILSGGIVQWAKVHTTMLPTASAPSSLIRLWVKMMCNMNQSLPKKQVGSGPSSIYSVLCKVQPPLSAGTIGLLLEEELLVYEMMDHQLRDIIVPVKNSIVELLLNKVYTHVEYSLEKSRVLMEKSRLLRLDGAENASTFMDHINEALSLLESGGESQGTPGDLQKYVLVKQQMAMAYSIRALSLYEMVPSSQDFLKDVMLSLKTWRCLLETTSGAGGAGQYLSNAPGRSKDFEAAVMLLLNVAELLSLKGNSALLHEAQELLLNMMASTSDLASDSTAIPWVNCRMSHLLCPVAFPPKFLASFRQRYPASACSSLFWENLSAYFPNSLLDAQAQIIFQDYLDQNWAPDSSQLLTENSSVSRGVAYIKKAISLIISTGRKTTRSVLELSELRYIIADYAHQKGDLREAIRNAVEALQLRLKLFGHIFCKMEKNPVFSQISSSTCRDRQKDTKKLEVAGLAATASWPLLAGTKGFSEISPSQWCVLGVYIESLMQVGIIYEKMGAVDDAERSFREGLRLAIIEDLPLALASFSSCLGELHCKRHLWKTSEAHFLKAEEAFRQLDGVLDCTHCTLTGQALLELRKGDLSRRCGINKLASRSDYSRRCDLDEAYIETLDGASSHYVLAEKSLHLFLFGLNADCSRARHVIQNHEKQQRVTLGLLREKGKQVSKQISLDSYKVSNGNLPKKSSNVELRRSARLSKSSESSEAGTEEQRVGALCHKMRKASIATSSELSFPTQRDVVHNDCNANGVENCPHIGMEVFDQEAWGVCDSFKRCICGFTTWETKECLSLEDWGASSWQKSGRRLLARILLQQGKCYVQVENFERADKILRQALSVLSICYKCHLFDMALESEPSFIAQRVAKSHNPIEEGALLYQFSMLFLRRNGAGRSVVELSHHRGFQPVNWLYRAYFLCSNMPKLLQKVAKLLAILHLPAYGGHFFPEKKFEYLCELAAYFHQASLGGTIRELHLAILDMKLAGAHQGSFKEPSSKACVMEMQQVLRVVPESQEAFDSSVKNLLHSLPSSIICCISFVDNEEVSFFEEVSCSDGETISTWLLITRLNTNCQPVVVLLPVAPILFTMSSPLQQDTVDSSSSYYLSDDDKKSMQETTERLSYMRTTKLENNQTLLERVLPEFGSILEESRLSTSGAIPVNTLEEKSKWWKWRMKLDSRLASLLRKMEDLWLGQFKYLLLGDPLQEDVRKAAQDFRIVSSAGVNSTNPNTQEEIDGKSHSAENSTIKEGSSRKQIRRCKRLAKKAVEVPLDSDLPQSNQSVQVSNIMGRRQPVQLVLDADAQEIPWESLPSLRNCEIYRMPSLANIRALYIQQQFTSSRHESHIIHQNDFLGSRNGVECKEIITDGVGLGSTKEPLPSALQSDHDEVVEAAYVNPCNAYYLLNPGGDLRSTEAAFGNWFKNQQGWLGKAGSVPTADEYKNALQSHELFIYLGHGSGEQYLSERSVRQLDECAASLLMGCSSGRLGYRGDYESVGVTLSYLLAGCPACIANLWDVTDGDIDRYSRSLLSSWLLLNEGDGNLMPGAPNSNDEELGDTEVTMKESSHLKIPVSGKRNEEKDSQLESMQTSRLLRGVKRMGSSVGEARDSCRLPYLIGASPVYYGLPTGICRHSL